jgi:hypothetical protein
MIAFQSKTTSARRAIAVDRKTAKAQYGFISCFIVRVSGTFREFSGAELVDSATASSLLSSTLPRRGVEFKEGAGRKRVERRLHATEKKRYPHDQCRSLGWREKKFGENSKLY